MLIVDAKNIKKYYGDRLILAFEELKIYKGDRIGIVGRNGSGKSTLINILSGEIKPDEGVVRLFCEPACIKQFADDDINADAKYLKEFGVKDKTDGKEISGGEYTRLKIADALSRDSVLLLADEPTTNLDFRGMGLLKEKLRQAETLLIISHDRDLLDLLCTKIIEVENGGISLYEGNYYSYQEQKRIETEREWFEFGRYTDEKERLEEAVGERQSKSKSMRKAPKRMGNSEARLHKRKSNEKKKKLDSTANSIKTRIEKLNAIQRPKELPGIKLDFSLTNPPENKIVIYCDDISFSYGSNVIFDHAGFKVHNGIKTAVVGENGSGKTTLLNLVSGRDERIYIAPKAEFGYFCQRFENLDSNKTVLQNVMRESVQTETAVRTILARLLISGDDVHKKVGVLSGGERIKVSFAKLFVSKANVLLLDEPTNYLDISSIEALQEMLCQYEGTVLFVSHDRAFLNAVADRLLVIENKRIIEFDGNLDGFEESRCRVR